MTVITLGFAVPGFSIHGEFANKQALHSDDAQLLEECISNTSDAVIRSTVTRLPAVYVVPFLTKIIIKFQAKPSRGAAF